MMFAQNYPFRFLGQALAYVKIFNRKIHRVGNAIMLGEDKLKEQLSLTDDDMNKLNAFLKSLGLDFNTDTREWQKKRQGMDWWTDAFVPIYSLHLEDAYKPPGPKPIFH